MQDSKAKSRIENVFITYHALLRRQGLSWIIKENQKVAVYHVLLAIHQTSFKTRFKSDLEFSKHNLRKNFKQFMKYAIKLADTFNWSTTES